MHALRSNFAVIAHVDHGKTSLVDAILRYCDSTFTDSLDSGEQERERGITILAKHTSFGWGDMVYNVIDTPGA